MNQPHHVHQPTHFHSIAAVAIAHSVKSPASSRAFFQACIVTMALIGLFVPNIPLAALAILGILVGLCIWLRIGKGCQITPPPRAMLIGGILLLICCWTLAADWLRGTVSIESVQHSISWLAGAIGVVVGSYAARASRVTPKILTVASLVILMFLLLLYCGGIILTGDVLFVRNHSLPDGWLFSNPNLLARMTLLAGIPLIALAASRSIRVWQASLTWIPLFLLITLTISRANIFALIMSFLVIIPISRWPIRIVVIMILLIGLLTTAFVPSAREFVTQAAGSISATINPVPMNTNTSQDRWKTMSLRARSWDASSQIVKSHPILGVGAIAEADFMRLHGSLKLNSNTVVVTHGAFLKLAAYSGLPAALLLVAAITSIGWPTRHQYRMPTAISDRSTFGRSMLMALGIALFFQSLSADSTGYLVTWIWIGIVIGVSIESQRTATCFLGRARRNQIHTSGCS